jgi:chromosome segregation ATPase
LPALRLELRHGSAAPIPHDVTSISFLVGTVPGCDLRLPGASLPAVCCLLTRRPDGVELRKLAPIGTLLVNGRPAANQALADGDRITLGAVELLVRMTPAVRIREPAVSLRPIEPADVDERSRQLREQTEELEADRVLWYQRREQIEQECRRQQEEVSAARRELAEVRQQLYDRYRQRRDRLAGLHQAIRRAARKVQERKGQVEAEAGVVAARREEEAVRKAQLDAQAEEQARERAQLDEQHRLFAVRKEELRREVAEKLLALQAREGKLAEDRQALEKSQAEHQAALARLDRSQAALEEREKRLRADALEIDKRFEQLQRDTRELEEQATDLDAWHMKLATDAEQLSAKKAEQETATAQLVQRSAALEGQQAMLAALRTRLERMREEVRREEEQLADVRARQEETETDLRRRTQEVQQLREELEAERTLRTQEAKRLEERAGLMEAAVARLREAQEALAAREAKLREREQQVEVLVAQQAEQRGLLHGRSEQVRELQERLGAERQALRERETGLLQSEQGLSALQEQLRRRSEEIAARQKEQEERQRACEAALAAAEARRTEIEAERSQAQAVLSIARQELDARAAELERREQALARNVERLKEAGRTVGGERKALAEERTRLEAEGREAAQALARARGDFDAARLEVVELQRQFPDLEARAAAAAERLAQAREQLREHLGELHTYAQDARADLEALRAQVQAEAERVRQQEVALHRERDEHRLAVAAFRQQLIDWQAQVAEMKRALASGETRLEKRLAEVDEQSRQVDETSARLAQQAEQLEQQERLVAERRGEVEQHLEDMREWYRRKLRELTGRTEEEPEAAPAPPEGSILTMTGVLDPGDRKLGDLLRSLELVDADTLRALLNEARRQRRSLRQLLLAGGYLTLYQMALIEAGNLDGLVLGPYRLIDRLRATPREVVYRVFDPRRGQEAVLRHLSEVEMQDAVHPDEFRQRFAAVAAVSHPHLAATLEIVEIADRPAVLQEWLTGLPSGDWPPLAAVPGVWYRLLCQVALGLHTLHQAGLAHGRLDVASIVLTADGTVKLCGAGEPAWLRVPPATGEGDAAADLAALGRIAAGWVELADGRKGPKPKPLPETLQGIVRRLTADKAEDRYPSAAVLLEELEKAGADVPANGAAWDRLLRQVRDEAVETALRLSA